MGVLAGFSQNAEYLGSDKSQFHWGIFPNFRYRGSILRSDDEEGARARLNSNPIYKFSLSFSGSFSAQDNEDRMGMPNLDYTAEFGPKLKIRLAEANGRWGKWELNFPLRFVFSSDFSYIDYQGLTFSPGIQGSYNQIFCNLCGLFFRVSFRFGSELYNDYFYQVDKIYATPTRAEFDADSGYLGSQLFLGYSLSIGKIQAFTGASFYNLSGSQIAKSPLVKQHTNTTLIFGIGWLFWQSEEKEYK